MIDITEYDGLVSILFPDWNEEVFPFRNDAKLGASVLRSTDPDGYYLKVCDMENNWVQAVKEPIPKGDVYAVLLKICPDLELEHLLYPRGKAGPAQSGDSRDFVTLMRVGAQCYSLDYFSFQEETGQIKTVSVAGVSGVPPELWKAPELN